MEDKDQLVMGLQLIDPILQFLLKATKEIDVPLSSLVKAFPAQHRHLLKLIPELTRRGVVRWEVVDKNEFIHRNMDGKMNRSLHQDHNTNVTSCPQQRAPDDSFFLQCLEQLIQPQSDVNALNERLEIVVGFPYKQNLKASKNASDEKSDTSLHGCTKVATKRRFKHLHESESSVTHRLDQYINSNDHTVPEDQSINADNHTVPEKEHKSLDARNTSSPLCEFKSDQDISDQEKDVLQSDEEKEAIAALMDLISSRSLESNDKLNPSQASYAGCRPEREAQYQNLSASTMTRIPQCLIDILNLDLTSPLDRTLPNSNNNQYKRLYSHQARAIESTFSSIHTLISTGTGSGKSLCFLIPILADVIQGDIRRLQPTPIGGGSYGCTAFLLFPTKALAQDQLSKLLKLLSMNEEAAKHCRPGIIDGDTPHEQREAIARECNIILTNPDTLHAHILPGWKRSYKHFLSRVRYIAIDELHLYAGMFGSHVRMVLSRLVRLCCCASLNNDTSQEGSSHVWTNPTFVGCSATVAYPEEHFRFLCPISTEDSVCIIDHENDGSPCCRKYFFLWNPPTIEQMNQSSRRHAADETAVLLAQAVKLRIRSIAFCATRMIAEWVYEKCSAMLKSSDSPLLEIYRGGYSSDVRRKIEERLFHNQIIAVVATSALEVGVDIGGIDIIFHCGYPGSYNSLTQQAGRAGRDKWTRKPSFSITVCFNSPAEQHLWKHPKALLTNNKHRPSTLPINTSIVQGHLLCAAEESPLTGSYPASILYGTPTSCLQSDKCLFGGDVTYDEVLDKLTTKGSLNVTTANIAACNIYKAHPSTKDAWRCVSLRSIEPLNYSIVDLHHPQQSNRVDRIYHKDAVLDTIPYSRVFYHAYPGAIIVHRGNRYKIVSMTQPPGAGSTHKSELMAFAEKVTAKYSTAALSITSLTVVKYLGRLETSMDTIVTSNNIEKNTPSFLAGHGVVNVKKQVHGYKKLSLVDRSELSRHEIRLPPMEYDSNAFWIDVDASKLRKEIKNFDEGVHALSHAFVALAPVFVPCSYSDIDCDHSHFGCTRILLYDTRAGGSGTSARLWDQIFASEGLLESAIGLLTACPSRCDRGGHEGGCPACIQAVPCSDFQNGLSKPAALAIAKHLLQRINSDGCSYSSEISSGNVPSLTFSPRRKKRLIDAADLERARERSILIGRPSWPTDE